jgi:membrane protease YdiL (CAAX protease family)
LLKFFNKMLQRIQTIYLFLAIIIAGILPFLFPLFVLTTGDEYYFMQNMVYAALFGLSITFSLLSIFSFKKRQNQFVINRLNMIFNLILLGLFVYRSLNLSGETPKVSEKGIAMFLPILTIILLVLANKAIKKDEDLVKSVDRLR